MDDFYDLVLATALVCSIDFTFSFLSNVSKGTTFLPGWNLVYIGEALLLILPFLGVITVVFITAILMGTRLAVIRRDKCRELEQDAQQNQDAIEKTRAQRAYPQENRAFWSLLMAHAVFIALVPLGASMAGADNILALGKTVQRFVLLICPYKP
jgi:hypothetical protein